MPATPTQAATPAKSLLLAGLLLLLAGAPAGAETADRAVLIGSKAFTESRLLAEIMAHLIRGRTELEVEHRQNLGGTMIVFNALAAGEIDLYPEYTGTLWYSGAILNREQQPQSALHAFAAVQQQLAQKWDLRLLVPFGFNNTYAMAVRAELAERLQLRTISDLAPHAGDLRIAVSHEFLERQDGWPALVRHYQMDAAEPRGIEHGLIYRALAADEIDLADSYSTDGKLLDYPVRLLEDDRNFFPPYQAAPLMSGTAARRWPQLVPLLGELGFSLSEERIRRLNHDAERDGDYARVARDFLLAEGLLRADEGAARPETAAAGSGAWSNLGTQVARHLWLSLISTLIAAGLALPLGILLARRPRLAAPTIWLTGMLQTVPALALFALLITLPGFGLGALSAITAISLYAVLPILRNTCTGIAGVDAGLIETVRALGLSDRNILIQVELPLALPTIMAGIRTAAVIAVGLATLAAFVGAGGLGDSILTGLQLVNTPLILAGAVPAALLALLTDLSLALVERWLRPRGLD